MTKRVQTKTYKSFVGRATKWLKLDNTVLWIVAVSGLILVSLLAFIGMYARPIADDYVWIYQANTMSIPEYMHQQLWYAYGRYTNALALVLLGKAFNSVSVIVAPLALILLLIVSAYYAATAFGIKKVRALALALTVPAFLLACLPSMFDAVYWMNSSTLYPMAIAGSLLVAGATVRIWAGGAIAHWKLAIALGLAFLAGGLNEIAPVINLLIIAVICVAWTGKKYAWRLYAIGAMVATQIIALAILKWAPGSLQRQSVAQSGEESLTQLLRKSLDSMGGALEALGTRHILLIVVASAVIALLVYNYPAVKTLSKDIWYKVAGLLAVAIALFVLPTILTLYAHSIRDDGLPPYRVQTYLIAGMILAFSTIVWLLCAFSRLHNGALKNTLLLVATGIALILSIGRISTTGQVLAQRAFLYDQRTAVANLQIDTGKTTLLLPQVPVYDKSDALDLPTTDKSDDVAVWVARAMATYLGVEQIKTDNSKNLQQCPTHPDWYVNYEYCQSIYNSAKR